MLYLLKKSSNILFTKMGFLVYVFILFYFLNVIYLDIGFDLDILKSLQSTFSVSTKQKKIYIFSTYHSNLLLHFDILITPDSVCHTIKTCRCYSSVTLASGGFEEEREVSLVREVHYWIASVELNW